MVADNKLQLIGRAELVEFPTLGLPKVPAKVDTGADSSAIWASKVQEKDGKLYVHFFGPKSKYYTGQPVIFNEPQYSLTRVANSFGHREVRYKLKLRVKVQGKLIRATFTLSDRSKKTYPVLLGRRLLAGKFLVDVKSGRPLKKQEAVKKKKLKKLIGSQELKKG